MWSSSIRVFLARVLSAALIATFTFSSSSPADSGCIGFCANASTFLQASQVERIIAQAVAEARARGLEATVAVVDRVGNVLGVFRTNGAKDSMVTIRSRRFERARPAPDPARSGLEELPVPATFAAIAKAITAAYLSSEGNAFTTRTANQIVQEFFNPGEIGQPGGPLFGVQFSSLPCGDLVQQGATVGIGPRRSPLGLSGDPGGLPLYLNGTPVGGIGVMADGIYGLDLEILDVDSDVDEIIALAGTFGFQAPEDRQADRITVIGLSLRFADVDVGSLVTNPLDAPPFAAITGGIEGELAEVPGFFMAAGGIQNGRAFAQPGSGIEPADLVDPNLFPGVDAFVLTDGASVNRFPPKDGAVNLGQQLLANEVTVILRQGLRVANQARAQIRQPPGSQARVTLSVVDTNGMVLGIARNRDAPVFGIDVSLQKARAAAFFSSPDAAASLSGAGLARYATAAQGLVDPPHRGVLFTDGTAFSNRAIGNLARPFFPDGDIFSGLTGPLSRPATDNGVFAVGINEWSPFNVGLQLDLVALDVLASLGLVPDRPPPVTDCSTSNAPSIALGRLANGIQIFPGSVPIYKAGVLVGALGISGDGVDQDDMVAFLGVHRASLKLGGTITNAPAGIRADNVTAIGLGLRYVQCPVAPFIDSDEQTPCGGK
jgi:uncharacterized protein GlcG (DUF336 family)